MRSLHCNASLPRAGSELMQALLSQHPEVYASSTSPLLEYWYGAYGNYGLAEVRSQDPEMMKRAFAGFCKGGAHGYYSALTDYPVVVDKSRGWLDYREWLWAAFPDARMITMVRPIEDIIASFERIYQVNLGHPETRELPKTEQLRGEHWLQNIPLSLALDRLNKLQSKGADDRILYVEYDDLVAAPVEIMRTVFQHIQLPPIDIDPNNVRKSVEEDDSHFGLFGQHTIRNKISRRENDEDRSNVPDHSTGSRLHSNGRMETDTIVDCPKRRANQRRLQNNCDST